MNRDLGGELGTDKGSAIGRDKKSGVAPPPDRERDRREIQIEAGESEREESGWHRGNG
jgi:hypothetical protein